MSKMVQGTVTAVHVSRADSGLPAEAVDRVDVSWEGFVGDKHAGLTMKAGSSQAPYPKGVEVRNVRQVSIVSAEELADVAAKLDVPRIEPAWLGANLQLSGIPELSQLPPGSRLYFENGVGLAVEGVNAPCTTAGGGVQAHFPGRADIAKVFPKVALGKRGLVAWVEKPGIIALGEAVQVRRAEDVRS